MIHKFALALLMTLLGTQTLCANPLTHMIKSGWRSVFGHGGRAVAREGVKHAGRQAAAAAAKQTVKTAVQSRTALAVRHFGGHAGKLGQLSGKLTAQNHRRLLILAPELRKTGQAGTVLARLAKSTNADKAVAFLWKHKGKLAAITAGGVIAWHAGDIAEAGDKYFNSLIDDCFDFVAKPVLATISTLISIIIAFLFIWKIATIWRLFSTLLNFVYRQLATTLKFLFGLKSYLRFGVLAVVMLSVPARAQAVETLPMLSTDQQQQVISTVGPWAKWLTGICEHGAFGPIASIVFFFVIITYSKRSK